MTPEQQLKRVIRDFDRDEIRGSDLDRWARRYGRHVTMLQFAGIDKSQFIEREPEQNNILRIM